MEKDTEQEKIGNKKNWNVTDKRFVCFLDIMGFKDMVMRRSHKENYHMLEKLSNARSTLESPNVPDGFDTESLKTVSFSDTIVIFTKNDTIKCLELLTFATSWLFGEAMQSGIPMKGAISHGEMSVDIKSQIFFGQPLIDAFLIQEELAFYGIVVHNTVEEILNQNLNNMKGKDRYFDCPVPFKSGKIKHYILDWASVIESKEKSIKENALKIMNSQREQTSGNPRKYIDNTIYVIEYIYK